MKKTKIVSGESELVIELTEGVSSKVGPKKSLNKNLINDKKKNPNLVRAPVHLAIASIHHSLSHVPLVLYLKVHKYYERNLYLSD